MEYFELGLQGITRKPNFRNKILRYVKNDGTTEAVASASSKALNSFLEFAPTFSSSGKVDDQTSSPIGVMNHKLTSQQERNDYHVDVENSVLCSPEHSASTKRARTPNLLSQIPVCQVLGCNKDLSSSKDYHKKHKVCDIHSKASVVIVNGIHQRFCQQCSRFHLLPEFDEGKRSCRKRLAGHNERWRKPQVDTHLDLSRSPFLFPKLLQVGLFDGEPLNSISSPSLSYTFTHKTTPFSVQERTADSNSSSALYLLSTQPQSVSSNLVDISMGHPLIFLDNHQSNLRVDLSSAESFSKSTLKNVFMSANEVGQDLLPDVLNASVSLGLDIRQNVLSQESNAPEGTNTVDLLQLSFHLQRVEHQKYSTQLKLGKGIFCHTATT